MEALPTKSTPRRRRKTKAEIIKEHYLPYLFLLLTLILIVVFVIGSVLRKSDTEKAEAYRLPDISATGSL